MEFQIFELPTQNDAPGKIESRWCELNTKFRNGETLDEIEIDWMDTANNWLMTDRNF